VFCVKHPSQRSPGMEKVLNSSGGTELENQSVRDKYGNRKTKVSSLVGGLTSEKSQRTQKNKKSLQGQLEGGDSWEVKKKKWTTMTPRETLPNREKRRGWFRTIETGAREKPPERGGENQ